MTVTGHLYFDYKIGITDAGFEHMRDRVSSKMQELGISRTSVTHDGVENAPGRG